MTYIVNPYSKLVPVSDISITSFKEQKMKESIAKKIIKCSGGELTLRKDYSGRGMFGEKTCGVVGNRYDLEDACLDAKVKFNDLRLDNMGLDHIIY